MKDIERRHYSVQGFHVEERAAGDSKTSVLVGHAAVFNQLSENLGGFREQVAPGAFSETIKAHDIRALFNHNPDFILGRNVSGTLRMEEDSTGLRIEIDVPDTQVGRDLMVSVQRGDVSQMSFGFSVMPDGSVWSEDQDGTTIRTLRSVRLFDVSPVVYPAYPQTDIAVRSLNDWRNKQGQSQGRTPEDISRELRHLRMQLDLEQ
jgi:HK97 family phage prohead protease